MKRHLRILGARGIPAAHGGFETFAEHLATYLVGRGWQVTVYCQGEGTGPAFEDEWHGVRRVHIPSGSNGSSSTVLFDWKSTLHAAREEGVVLTLGYNTALFCAVYRLKRIKNVINMDGVEWRRKKWGGIARGWFWMNDWLGCWLGNHLVADHPEIARHLATRVPSRKITMIPYGADRVEAADPQLLERFGLIPRSYAMVVARAEPENSLLEIVRAWSSRRRGYRLLVLGNCGDRNRYQQAVRQEASSEVMFPGGIYDKSLVNALRFHSRLYVHGHQVGGTNPSLVEALGAGNAVIAHDNRFNRWVAENGARYFRTEEQCAHLFEQLMDDEVELNVMAAASRARHDSGFAWGRVLRDYESLLLGHTGGKLLPRPALDGDVALDDALEELHSDRLAG